MQDGGYHVPFAHKGLASGLHLDSYTSSLYERTSIQSCAPQQASAEADQRLGKLSYHIVYYNLHCFFLDMCAAKQICHAKMQLCVHAAVPLCLA
jgi:hypothetical protein